MQREHKIGLDLIKLLIGEDSSGARSILFGRLEQQYGPPSLRALTIQAARHRRQNRHMTVVTAKMRFSRYRRPIRQSRNFLNRQSIELGAKHDRRAGRISLVDPEQAMPAKSRDDLVGTSCVEKRLHGLRGLLFLP